MNFNGFAKIFSRECKNILKSKDILLICVAAPLFYNLLFSYLYINRRATDINIGVVNADTCATPRKLIRSLAATPELKTTEIYASSREALIDIFKDKIDAFYFIPNNFSKKLKKGQTVSISDVVNSSNFLLASNVLKKVTLTTIFFSKKQFIKILNDKGYSYKSAKSAFSPININTVYLFNTQMNYSDFLLPCLLLAVLQQILLVAICTSIASEKGKLNVYKNTGVSFSAVFFGKACPFIIIGSFINLANIFIILPINSIYVSSFFGLFVVSTAFIMAMTFFAILISSLFRSPEISMVALMFYSLPTVLLSGFAWPHNVMPTFLKIVSYIFPSTYSMNYVRMFILGDVSIRYAINPTIKLILFSIICFFVSYIVESKTKKIFHLKETK